MRVRTLLLRTGGGVAGLLTTGAMALAAFHVLDATPPPAEPRPAQASFDSDLLVLVDADMAATAYADGALHPIEGATDALVRVGDGAAEEVAAASNTVMGWPGATALSADGRTAYVVESRGPAPEGVEVFGEGGVYLGMPMGRLLQAVDLATGEVASVEVCLQPLSVDVAPAGDWLLVACGDAGAELVAVPVRGDALGEPVPLDLDVPNHALRPIDEGASYAVIHPSGEAAGVVLNSRAVLRVAFEMGDGVPVAATAGEPLLLEDRWLTVARWTRSGGYLLVADVAWGPAPLDAVTNGAGAILSLDMEGAPRVVSEARVGKSPEAFEMNRAGDLLAVVNMERTYLPGGPLAAVPGRSASSLSLVAVDEATGELATQGPPVGFRGVLPEDAAFDADGDAVAVVVYQDHDAPRSDGWLAFFDIVREEGVPRATLTDRRVALPRGGHDLVALDR